ncbi:MAG TPA: hypothetical protein VMZ92_13130 [Planctomycetota bacterium]|nr:hypothetical protein [Planctomycetota bacterium]
MGTWFNVLIVVLFAALVGVFFFGYFSASTPVPSPAYSSETTIYDKGHGEFTAGVSMWGNELPDVEFGVDEVEATVSFAELRAGLKLTDEEDKRLAEFVETWDTLTDDEKIDALGDAMKVIIQIITNHPAELKALILKKAEGAKETAVEE